MWSSEDMIKRTYLTREYHYGGRNRTHRELILHIYKHDWIGCFTLANMPFISIIDIRSEDEVILIYMELYQNKILIP